MKTKIENIKVEYMKQATRLSLGAEILPGGVTALARKLHEADKNKKPLRVKLGMDPTRPDLHLGHSVVMRKLKLFQELGHQIVLIVGGATAMVGDPSGKSQTRPSLTKAEVESNAKTYFEQMSKIIDIEKAEVVNNADWLHPMKLVELLKLASNVTVAQMMVRDDFAKRYKDGTPISVHEFFYPLMQSYDSVEIDADIELGGTDQRFNLLLGRDIQQAYGKTEPQLAFLLPLIEGTDGQVKMSKTYPEHCISLTDSANDMYGKIMSIPDSLIIKYFTLLTDIDEQELKQLENRIARGENPRDIKMKLAYTITNQYYDDEITQKAEDEFVNVVQNKGLPSEVEEYKLTNPVNILDFLVEMKFSQSKGEAKRLIQGGGVKIENEKIDDITLILDKPCILQAGKRKFVKLVN